MVGRKRKNKKKSEKSETFLLLCFLFPCKLENLETDVGEEDSSASHLTLLPLKLMKADFSIYS